jgi:hypothetical protein
MMASEVSIETMQSLQEAEVSQRKVAIALRNTSKMLEGVVTREDARVFVRVLPESGDSDKRKHTIKLHAADVLYVVFYD